MVSPMRRGLCERFARIAYLCVYQRLIQDKDHYTFQSFLCLQLWCMFCDLTRLVTELVPV